MNSSREDGSYRIQESEAAEETLRLVAALPVPMGLEDRVKAGLHAAAQNGIVFVVAGGGWGVYSRVQPVQSPKVIAMPQRINTSGGFSNAGAMRTPQTLTGPILAHPVEETPKQNDGDVKVVTMPKKARHQCTTTDR